MANPTKTKTLDVARKCLGTKESPSGSNRTWIGAWFGLNGYAWCAMTQSYILITAGFKIAKNSGADELGAELLHYGWKKISPSAVQSGDIVVYTFSHIGICEVAGSDGRKLVIEGNHNDACVRVWRSPSSMLYGVRPPYSTGEVVKPVADTSWGIPLAHAGNNSGLTRYTALAEELHDAHTTVQVPEWAWTPKCMTEYKAAILEVVKKNTPNKGK